MNRTNDPIKILDKRWPPRNEWMKRILPMAPLGLAERPALKGPRVADSIGKKK